LSIAVLAYLGIQFSTIAIIYVVLAVHELGHYLLMKRHKYKDISFGIIPAMGAFVAGEPDMLRTKQHMQVILAGPLPGILVGLILFIINVELQNPMLEEIAEIFILLNAFNLLPISILDGGRLISILFLNNTMQKIIFSFISQMLTLGMMLYFQNIFLLILAIIQNMEMSGLTSAHRNVRWPNIFDKTMHDILTTAKIRKVIEANPLVKKRLIRIDKSAYPAAVLIYDDLSLPSKIITTLGVLSLTSTIALVI
jgi:Zn-dependent protease